MTHTGLYEKNYLLIGTAVIFICVLMLQGCAGEKNAKKDPLFEKWETMAKTSEGHSPSQKKRVINISEVMSDEKTKAEEKMAAPARPLPTNLVSLKMRQADVKAVLRSLARAVGHNIFVRNEIKGEITVDFREVPWDQAFMSILQAHGLSYKWEGNIIRVLTIEDMEHNLKVSSINDRKITQEMEVKRVEPLRTMVVNINYADAKALKENLQEFLTKDKDGKITRGSVRMDEHSNSLIIQAVQDDLNKMIPVIERIDKPTSQILIKANIVETSKDTARNLGIQWGGMLSTKVRGNELFVTPAGIGGTVGTNPLTTGGAYTPLQGSAGISGHGFGINFPASSITSGASGSLGLIFGKIGGDIIELQLNALQEDSKINILSSPSIMTLDNQKAFTENGEKVPYVSVDKDGNREVKFEDAVLRLEITPHVIDEKNLKMKIFVKKDEVDTTRTVDGNPFIIKKQTETNLIVQDGETIVISGLTKHRKGDSNSGIPWFKDVPVLGWLFKNESKEDKMEEVLIFITPHMLPPQVTETVQSGQETPPPPEVQK